MYTKQELDSIWETKPYGWFTREVKSLKGKRKFKVTCTAFKEVSVGETSQVIYAKDPKSAIDSASASLRSKLNVELGLGQWNNGHIYKYGVVNA